MARYLLCRVLACDTKKLLLLFAIERGRDLMLLPLDSTSSIVPIKAITAMRAAREKYPIADFLDSNTFYKNLWRLVMDGYAHFV
jgi:hypothetical protein